MADYDRLTLLPPESVILARYREAITGRVLDVGCGAGRMLAYLTLLGDDVHGVDLSEAMVAHCRARYPGIDVHVGDLRDLRATETGRFEAMIMPDNLLDVFSDLERREVLADLRPLLAPSGLLIFSSHNLDAWDREGGEPAGDLVRRSLRYARNVARASSGSRMKAVRAPLVALANRRRLAPLQRRASDHAIINDSAHEWSLLHYYIGHLAQKRQLEELGFDVVEVLEADGTAVASGIAGVSPWLYYVARIGMLSGADPSMG